MTIRAALSQYGIVGLLLLVVLVRAVLARRRTPRRQERHDAIAALCQQRGLVAGPVQLGPVFEVAMALSRPVFENTFSSPDGGASAADLWRLYNKSWYGFSMLAFRVAGLNMPHVEVSRRDIPGRTLGLGMSPVGLESIDFNSKFVVTSADRRAAVMLLDEQMIQWLLDCEEVGFEIGTDRVVALVRRRAEPTYQPTLGPGFLLLGQSHEPYSNPRKADPVELGLLFKFWDGFVPRLPALLRTEFPSSS